MSATTQVTIGHFSREYTLTITTAPRAYDYEYVIEVGETYMPPDCTIPARAVYIPTERVEYQCARYASGLYGYATDGLDDYIAESEQRLIDKLFVQAPAPRFD